MGRAAKRKKLLKQNNNSSNQNLTRLIARESFSLEISSSLRDNLEIHLQKLQKLWQKNIIQIALPLFEKILESEIVSNQTRDYTIEKIKKEFNIHLAKYSLKE